MDMFALEAWLKECEAIYKAISQFSPSWPDDETQRVIFEKAIRPYHYFLMDAMTNARAPAGAVSPFGSERIDAGTAHQSGGSATAKAETSSSTKTKCISCGKDFEPKFPKAVKCYPCWKRDNPKRQ